MGKKLFFKLYTILCLFLIPVITTAIIVILTTVSVSEFYNELLHLHILPVLLFIWFVTLLAGIVYSFVKYRKKKPVDDSKNAKLAIGFSLSAGFFIFCSFIQLFAQSILLGGFHAS